MTPSEFDSACRLLESRFAWLNAGSGQRSVERNAAVGGSPVSKHLIGMARDYTAPTVAQLRESGEYAGELGLWYVVHDKGSGVHLHVQGLAPGSPPDWWIEYVNRGRTAAGG